MLRDASQSQKKQDSDSGEEDEENTEDWVSKSYYKKMLYRQNHINAG